jgi:hypothetical protein
VDWKGRPSGAKPFAGPGQALGHPDWRHVKENDRVEQGQIHRMGLRCSKLFT